ncbi:aminotransferase class V-fold PLP-dependent enzyme [Pollutimonas bauzanensis]|uniref:aminotransferase class V-fold PLP-dependent enzyme n=1 Tax=Pollutimonas bauzanensis TaxID=658167 RepID=UPI0015B55CCF|nr:aminotransferase class V-fold PLP-dependent enzyme [Pollutimonas bauzanensis]
MNLEANLSQIRSLFPVTRELVYLDLGGRAPLATPVRAALDAYLDDCMYGRIDKSVLFETTEKVRDQFAALINCHPDEVTYTKNTSEGLNMVCTAMQWRSGDNVIICPELEHPNNIYLWLNLRQHGVEVRFVHHENGFMPVDAMIAAMDERTRLLTASSISFSPGFRTDLEKVGRACRANGTVFLVDGAQSVGVSHTDVKQMNIDALSVSTQKGMLGLYGMGFLYIRRELAEKLRPAYIARFSIDMGNADAHESDFGGSDFKFMAAARRFDLGNYNFPAVCAAHASLELILKIGTKEIDAYVTSLATKLADGFTELGLPVCGGAPGPHTGQIVTVGQYGSGGDSGTNDELLNGLYRYLLANKVKLSMRRGLLRFSMHIYNNMDEIKVVLGLTRKYIGELK